MKIKTTRDIGLLMREARSRKGLSQAALAKMINVTQTWISWVENGKPTAEIGSVLLALSTLGVEMDFRLPPASTSAADDGVDLPDDDDDVPYKL